MRRIFMILFALALALSFSMVMATPVAADDLPNTVASSTMVFKGELTAAGGGVYTGTIPMVNEETEVLGDGIAGFDVYAKNGADAYVEGLGTWTIANHDAYGAPGPWGAWYDPDCADWDQYSLELTADHWYLRYTATGESPMSGVMYWYGGGTGYAAETDLGTVRNDDGSNPTDPLNRDATRYASGSAQEWGWHCGWGEERIPLELPGFAVQVTPSGSYTVTLTPAEGPVKNLNTSVTYGTIQLAVDDASGGDTLAVSAGTYVEVGQIIIDKDLTIIGENKTTTIIKPSPSFSDYYLFRVNAGEFNLSNVTLDGNGNLYGGVRFTAPGTGTLDNNIFKNIVFPDYTGIGVVVYGDDVTVSNNIFTNIGRVGVWVGGDNALVTGNIYTGKGEGDWLDYGIEVGMGGAATITDNTITNCLGVASSDGSTSAGILVTTYFGAGTTATITGNTLTGNTGGIGVGYDEYDTSTVVAHYNNISGNIDYGIDTTAPTVDATGNWWGSSSGPSGVGPGTGDSVSDNVDYSPWWGANYIGVAHPWNWYTNDSIQDAVDAASAGDTVNVVAGTYAGFEVTKDDLTIQGPIDAVVSGAAPTRDAVVYIGTGVSSVTIQGLTINAAGVLHGIQATESGTYSSITIVGSTIKDFRRSGIVVMYVSAVQLEGNTIQAMEHSDWAPNGIQIGYIGATTGTTGTVEGNQISGCHWDGYDPETETYEDEWTGSGILVIDDNSALEISDNLVQGCDVGMDIESGTPTTITGNVVHDNSYGFVLWNAAPTINYNNIYQNVLYGVYRAADGDPAGIVDATYNWWGAASGPYNATLNPSGTGNAVSDNVDFDPWALAEFPTVTTQAATSITTNSAVVNMIYTMGNYASVEVRFGYKKSTDMTWFYTSWVSKSSAGTYSEPLTGLPSGTTYDFKAELRYNDILLGYTTIEGATLQFSTLAVPTVTTQAATEIGYMLAHVNMDYTVGDFSPVQVRFAYKRSGGSTWYYTSWMPKVADGSYSAPLGTLLPGNTYHFKAQLKYDDTIIEGAERVFIAQAIEGCFIATAAYGTSTAEQIDVLREFRDGVLLKSTLGSKFVSLYYRFSPPVADFIAGHELVRTAVRELVIDPIVWMVRVTGDIWRK